MCLTKVDLRQTQYVGHNDSRKSFALGWLTTLGDLVPVYCPVMANMFSRVYGTLIYGLFHDVAPPPPLAQV